jgi:hypothetical protein
MAAATASDPRAPALRKSWFGTLLLLAYLPDVSEWALKIAGVRMQHSVPASLLIMTGCCGLTVLLFRLMGEQRRWVWLLGATAVASHTLLDTISSGVPLFWPFSSQVMQWPWLEFEGWPLVARLIREALISAPLLGLGVAIGFWRARPSLVAQLAVGGLLGAVLIASMCGLIVGPDVACMIVAYALVAVMGLAALWRNVLWRMLAPLGQLAAALPVLALGASQVWFWCEFHTAAQYQYNDKFAEAIAHYRIAERLPVLGYDGTPRARIALCYFGLGDEERAWQMLKDLEQKYPGQLEVLDGLAEIYLSAATPRFQRPDIALKLIECALTAPLVQADRRYFERRAARARAAVAAMPHG